MDNHDKDLLLVDSEDCIVGVGKALRVHHRKHLCLHRAFSVFLFNSRGDLLVQKRASKKLVFPDKWTNSTCSHPFANDMSFRDPLLDVKIHAVRRIEYELGIGSLRAEDLRFVARVLYKATDTESYSRLLPGEPMSQPVGEFVGQGNLAESYTSRDFKEWEVDYVLVAKSDDVCSPNREEVADVRYVDRAEFGAMVKTEEVSPWLREISETIDIFENSL